MDSREAFESSATFAARDIVLTKNSKPLQDAIEAWHKTDTSILGHAAIPIADRVCDLVKEGFIKGAEHRQAEIDALKAEVERLKQYESVLTDPVALFHYLNRNPDLISKGNLLHLLGDEYQNMGARIATLEAANKAWGEGEGIRFEGEIDRDNGYHTENHYWVELGIVRDENGDTPKIEGRYHITMTPIKDGE